MPKKSPNILIAGGGTGGHLFPALAIADEIRKLEPNAKFLFAGSRGKIEARVVPERGFAFETIWISGFHRGMRLQNLLFPLRVVVSLFQSVSLIRRFRPDVVVGTGGYVCGPILFAASLRGIPTAIHESNSYPGVTTRLLSGRMKKVFTAFEATNRWLRRTNNVELVGTPTRELLDNVSKETAIRFFELDHAKKTVLVFGGSLGATSINQAMMKIVEEVSKQNVQFIWQTGEKDFAEISKAIDGKNIGWVGAFIDRMEYAYAAADIAVSRSGATTIAELTRVGKPAVLVPYPHAAADHQSMNAETVAMAGAAIVVKDKDALIALGRVIVDLLKNPSKMESMSVASKSLGKPGAGRVIAEKILGLAA